jgi:hypothetical protein
MKPGTLTLLSFNLPTLKILRELSDDEMSELKDNIEQNGVKEDITVDPEGNVIDGAHRLIAAAECGITRFPVIIESRLTTEQKVQLALDLNPHRLTIKKGRKCGVNGRTIRSNPKWPTVAIGVCLPVDHQTAAAINRQLGKSETLILTKHRCDKKGRKRYPSFFIVGWPPE